MVTVTSSDDTLKRNCRSVLVLGAATLTGFHVSRCLALRKNVNVIGVDNLHGRDNRTKTARAFELYRLGIAIHSVDVCEEGYVAELVEQHGVSCFVHVIDDEVSLSGGGGGYDVAAQFECLAHNLEKIAGKVRMSCIC